MRKLINTLLLGLFCLNLHAQTGKIHTEKDAQQVINFFCDVRKGIINDPKSKAWKPDQISSDNVPAIYTEAEFDKGITLFNKSLSVNKSPFKGNELRLYFDEYHVLNQPLTKLNFNVQKLVTTKLKEMPIRVDVVITPSSWEKMAYLPINMDLKDSIQRIDGELTVKYYAQFKTYTFSKADIGKPRNINGINFTLKALENGFYQYETDKKGDSTWITRPFSKDNEQLSSDNFAMSTSRLLDSLLQNAKYVDKKGWFVTDDVTKKVLQLINAKAANDKVYEKGSLVYGSAKGTIDHIVLYVPSDLRTKKYKITVHSETSGLQERYEDTRQVRKFVTVDEAQIKAQFKPTVMHDDMFSSDETLKKKLSFDIPANENMKMATIEAKNLKGLKNGKWEKIEFNNNSDAYRTNLTKGYYKTFNLKIANFDAIQGEIRFKFPASFTETTKKKSDFFDEMAFDKKEEEDRRKEEAKTDEQRAKEYEAKTDEELEKEQKESNKPAPIYPFILTSKNTLSILDNSKGDAKLIVRAFDKNGWELKADDDSGSFRSDVAVYRSFKFWGEIETLKIYEVSKWTTTTIPFQTK